MKQHTRMRHFFALAFALVMAVFLLPMAAFATSSNYVAQVTSSDPDMGGGGVVYYTTLQGALEACAEADYFMGGLDTVTLLQDVVITQTLTVADKEYGVITLDLNGYGIDADGGNFSVITVSENAYFVLKDSSGSTRTTTFDDPTSDDESDVITVTGGYITGSALTSEVDNTSVYGGGVYLAEGAFFSMESGTIVGNTVRNSDTMGSSAYGGGVYVGEGASLRMSGGTITGNHASGSTATSYADAIAYGGGVYLDTGATLSIYGSAAITNNLARYGGGVSVGSGATLDMAGDAQISNNKAFATGSSIAAVGGGVVATADAIVKISSGSISGNQVVSAGYAYGGGIYATRASVTLSGTATISGNNATSTNTGTGTYVSGGGVYVVSTAMEMYDNAVISANSLTLPSGYGSGGGVHQEDSTSYPSTFALYGNASIRGNTAIGVGGGVSIEVTNDSSYFNMSGEASITGNTASEKSYVNGGGVYLASGTFHMSGGEISGNETISTATYGSEIIYGGGGVAVYSNGTFTMSGGTISGNTATNATSYYSLNANGGGVLVIWDGTFTISGGSITGNEAKQAGGGVYLARGTVTLAAADGNDAAPIEITGNTTTTGTVSNFYLADGYTIVVGSTPTSGSSIGVTLAAPSAGAAVTTAGAAAAGVFAYDDDTYMVVGSTSTDGTAYTLISGDTVASVTDKDGAVTYYTSLEGADGAIAAANDAASKIEIPTSDSTDEFVLLTLLKSVTTNDTLTFTSMYITLDLNGYTIAAKEGNTFPVITIRGDADLYVTLTDSVGTGTITGGNAAYGGGVYVVNGNFIMNGGSISGNQATMGGGVYVNNSASFTMAGGSISDNSATLYGGGGVYLDNNASFSMSGGSITGNAASTSGGGVYVAATVSADATAHGSFTISGGSITGNTASTSGGGVYLCYPDSMCLGAAEGGNTDITITGNTLADKTTANNVYLEKETTYLGKVVTTTLALQSALTSTSRIGVTHGDVVGTLATGVSAANRLSDTAVLVPDDSSYSVLETSSSGSYTYLLGIATASVTIDGTTTEYSTLEGENGALAAANAAGTSATITLLADATTSATLTVTGTVTLDLNGYGITYGGSSDAPVVMISGGDFTLTDSNPTRNTETPKTFDDPTSEDVADVITVTGGYLTGGSATYDSRGGGVYLASGSFTMSGGTIVGNYSTQSNSAAGGVYVAGGSFIMDGGTITGNTSNSTGAGVNVAGGSFTMNGGSITQNVAANNGGGVYTSSAGAVTITGGEISGNTAANAGGGVYASNSFVTIGAADASDNSTIIITGNTVSGSSNNLCVSAGQTIAVQSSVTGDSTIGLSVTAASDITTTAVELGSAYIIDDPDTYVMITFAAADDATTYALVTASTVARLTYTTNEGDKASYYNSLEDDAAAGASGAVTVANALGSAANHATITLLQNVETAATLRVTGYITLDLNGYTIDAKGGAFSVITVSGGFFTLTDSSIDVTGTITGGNSGTHGGGVYVSSGSFTMNSGSITNNSASRHGGGVYVSSGSFIMNSGSITENNAASHGGGVYVAGSGSFIMYGGSITDNNADAYGGGVYVENSGSFTMVGGSITGNNADVYGGGVYAASSITIGAEDASENGDSIIKGNTKAGTVASNLYLAQNQMITLRSTLTSGSTIGISHGKLTDEEWLYSPVAFDISEAGVAAAGALVLDDDTYTIFETLSSGSYTYSIGIAVASVTVDGVETPYATVEDAIAAANAAASAIDRVIISSNPIVITLLADVTTNDSLSLYGLYITLDLSGHSIAYVGSSALPVLKVMADAVVTLTDSSSAATGTIKGGSDSGVVVYGGASLSMDSGNITGNTTTTNGGGVYVVNGGSFSMYGGSITDNDAAINGSGVYVASGGSFSMSGGSITNNDATANGSGVYFEAGGAVTLSGAAAVVGNSIYLASGQTLGVAGKLTGSVTLQTEDAAAEDAPVSIALASGSYTLSASDAYVFANADADALGSFTLVAAASTESGSDEIQLAVASVASGDSAGESSGSSAVAFYIVSLATNGNGSITPSVSGYDYIFVEEGVATLFYFTPAEGYEVYQVYRNGVALGALSQYTLANVTDTTSLYVQFAPEGTLAAQAAANGSASDSSAASGSGSGSGSASDGDSANSDDTASDGDDTVSSGGASNDDAASDSTTTDSTGADESEPTNGSASSSDSANGNADDSGNGSTSLVLGGIALAALLGGGSVWFILAKRRKQDED